MGKSDMVTARAALREVERCAHAFKGARDYREAERGLHWIIITAWLAYGLRPLSARQKRDAEWNERLYEEFMQGPPPTAAEKKKRDRMMRLAVERARRERARCPTRKTA